jgi:hypothetical protein
MTARYGIPIRRTAAYAGMTILIEWLSVLVESISAAGNPLPWVRFGIFIADGLIADSTLAPIPSEQAANLDNSNYEVRAVRGGAGQIQG